MVFSEMLVRSLCIKFETKIYEYETSLGNGIKRSFGNDSMYSFNI